MKKLFLTILLFTANTYSQSFDTLTVKTVASGITHYHIRESNIPWNLHFLEVDLTNEYIKIESAKGNDKLAGKQKLSDFVSSNSYEGHEVIGAINGDFFDGDGVPTGIQVLDGEILTSIVARDWSKIGFTDTNMPMINRPYFSGKLITNESSYELFGINRDRDTDKLVLYNGYKDNTTGTNQWGTEVVVEPLGEWFVNDTLGFVVNKIENNIGNMSIERPLVVLSGHGQAKTFLDNNVTVGDTVFLVTELLPGIKKIKELVSGFPQIVKDGTNYALQGYEEEGGSSTFATDRHPRTGAGFSEDKSKLFYVVVDGRQPNLSLGMSLPELADFMIGVGVHTGLNLDGGGSTEMIVKNSIVNSPSDGSERAVANALLVISSEPENISTLELSPDFVVTDLNNTVQYDIAASDSYGNIIEVGFQDITINVDDSSIGSIDSNGLFIPESDGKTFIIAKFGEVSDTSHISVEFYEGVQLLNSFDNLNDWYLTGDGIDTTESSISITSEVSSEGETSLKLDYQFTYQSGLLSWAYLNCDINVSGVPANLGIDTQLDSSITPGKTHSIALVVENFNGEQFALLGHKKAHTIDEFSPIWTDFNNPIPLSEDVEFHFPVTIKQIAVILGSEKEVGETYKGTIFFDNLRAVYPDAVTDIKDDAILVSGFTLHQNYPNPFNPTTTIKYNLPVVERYSVSLMPGERFGESLYKTTLKVYDVLGREVAVLVNENQNPGNYSVRFDASELSSGIYFYRLSSAGQSITKKLTLLK